MVILLYFVILFIEISIPSYDFTLLFCLDHIICGRNKTIQNKTLIFWDAHAKYHSFGCIYHKFCPKIDWFSPILLGTPWHISINFIPIASYSIIDLPHLQHLQTTIDTCFVSSFYIIWLVVYLPLWKILVSCFTPCRSADDCCSCARDAWGVQKVRPCWSHQNEHANPTLTPKPLKGKSHLVRCWLRPCWKASAKDFLALMGKY